MHFPTILRTPNGLLMIAHKLQTIPLPLLYFIACNNRDKRQLPELENYLNICYCFIIIIVFLKGSQLLNYI